MAETQSNTPTQMESTAVVAPHTPAPLIPADGAASAAPLTGQGPQHKQEEKKIDGPPQTTPQPQSALPRKPPAFPPKRPPQAVQPTSPQPGPQNVAAPQAPTPAVPPQLSGLDPAMASLVTAALGMQQPAAQKFMLLVLPEDGWPSLEQFDNVTPMIDRLKGLVGQQVCVHAFLGHHLPITAGPHRFLKTPMGNLPLFEIPDPATADATQFGWLGKDMDTPQAPTSDEEDIIEEIAESAELEQAPPPPPPPALTTVMETPMFSGDES